MRLQAPILWLAACAVALCGCGSDASTQRPDSGWQIEESGDVAEETPVPDGLPDDYVDHPHEERVHSWDFSKDACRVPEGEDDAQPPFGYHRLPDIGSLGILAVQLRGDVEKRLDKYNYDVYIRFPRKSDEWHRFEVRYDRHSTHDFYQTGWKGIWEDDSYLIPNISYRLKTGSCDKPTQEEIDAFLYHYSIVELVFHDRATNRVFSFGPAEPLEFYSREPDTVFSDNMGASILFDFPLNRPPARGPHLAPDDPSTADEELRERLLRPWQQVGEPCCEELEDTD